MERCGFFNANLVDGEYDRTYLADQFAAYFASFIGNGVYAKKSSKLKVSEMSTQGMGIVVKSGQAWINGYWYENTEDKEFTIDAADGTLKRIDSVVLRWGAAERSMWLQVNKGTPAASPVAPALVRSADYYDLQLATIYVDRAVIKITQSAITDTRASTSVCGWVTGVVDQIDTTELFNQFETYFQEFKYGNEADFNAWFDKMKGQLSEDAAGHLQNQIDVLAKPLVNIALKDYSDVVQPRTHTIQPGAWVDYYYNLYSLLKFLGYEGYRPLFLTYLSFTSFASEADKRLIRIENTYFTYQPEVADDRFSLYYSIYNGTSSVQKVQIKFSAMFARSGLVIDK